MRTLTAAETAELNQLAQTVVDELKLNGTFDEDLFFNLAHQELEKSKGASAPDDGLAFKLGSYLGNLIQTKYHWEWRFIQRSGFDYYGLLSPNQNWFVPVHSLIYMILNEGKSNNLRLLYNMLQTIEDNQSRPEPMFLN